MPRASGDHGAMAGYRIVGVLTLVAIAVSFAVVWPVGDYAIDDDWAYVRALEHLQRDGRITILQWNPMSLVGHLAWGWLFTTVFGLSFTVTKLAVVVSFMLECVVVLALLRHFDVPPRLAGLAVATLLFDPLHFFHAFQFTTDVPMAMWVLLALLLYARALDGATRAPTAMLVLASTCVAMAFLVRQSGAVMAVAVGVSLLVSDRRRLASPRFLLAAFGPVTIAVAGFTWWYYTVHGPTQAHTEMSGVIWSWLTHPVASDVGTALFIIAIYVGLFAVPLTLAALPSLGRLGARQRGLLLVLGLLGAAVLLGLGLGADTVFPYLRNKVTPFGYMRPNEFILGNRPVLWPDGTEWVLAALGLVSVLALVVAGLGSVPRPRDATRRGRWLLLTFVVGQLAYSVVTWPIVFDRHLLVLVPATILLYAVLVRDTAVVRRSVFAVLLTPLVFVSVAGTHDIHAISRTAFQAGEDALATGVDPLRLDAGYAFDGWHVFEAQRVGAPMQARSDDAWWVRTLMPTIRTDYVVSLTPTLRHDAAMERIAGPNRALFLAPRLDGRRVVRRYPYRTLWPPARAELYLLARE